MHRRSQRVVLSDSESTDNANTPKRCPTHLTSNNRSIITDISNGSNNEDSRNISYNSDEDDLGNTSGKPDDGTSSATSIKNEPGRRKSAIQWGDRKSMPMRGPRTVKEKVDMGDSDPHNITSLSLRAFNKSDPLQNDDDRLDKRQRLTRGHGRSTVSYDMKHHPMDDVLRPKYSAKRRARGTRIPEDSSDSGSEIYKATTRQVIPLDHHRRRSSRNTHRKEAPIYNARWHPLDQILKKNTPSINVLNLHEHSRKTLKKSDESSSTLKDEEDPSVVSSDLDPNLDACRTPELSYQASRISSGRRRSARVSSSKDPPPNYDMKYHVMDATLRPKASAKRMMSKLHSITSSKSRRKSVSHAKPPTKQLAKASPKSLPSDLRHHKSDSAGHDLSVAPVVPQRQNPYLNQTSLGWSEVQHVDRCVYLLRKGAPLHDGTLIMEWTCEQVKKVLFDKGVTTLDELNSWEGIVLLEDRYESVRLGLQNFFDSKPEPVNRTDWTLSKSEGFDVYDVKRGSTYRRHQKNGVMEGAKTSSSANILGFAAEMATNRTGVKGQEARDIFEEELDTDEAKATLSMQHVHHKGTGLNKPSLKWPPAMEIDIKRTTSIDCEDDSEPGVTVAAEDALIENMRGEPIHSSVMSDVPFEELWLPAEQYLTEVANQEVTDDLVSSDSRYSGPTRLVPAYLDNFLDKLRSVASEAKATDLEISPDPGLAQPLPLGKDEMAPVVDFGPCERSDEPQTPKAEVKMRKRKPRVDVAIAVHEDLPGRTPLVKKIVDMNPASPGTDLPKENLGDNGFVERSSQVEMRTPRIRRQHEAISTLSSRRVRNFGTATGAALP